MNVAQLTYGTHRHSRILQGLLVIYKTNPKRSIYTAYAIFNSKFTKALNYRIFKKQFETENYLHILDDNYLFEFCKFITLNHKLPIEYGRWQNIAKNMRFCNLCNQNEIGDECHYMLECNLF